MFLFIVFVFTFENDLTIFAPSVQVLNNGYKNPNCYVATKGKNGSGLYHPMGIKTLTTSNATLPVG
jgi:hypothetical protein